MHQYPELSGVEVEASFYDNEGNATLPETVHWKLDCTETNRLLVDWTEVVVSSEDDGAGGTRYYAVIDVPGSANAIQKNGNRRELKELTVVANKDDDREYSQPYQYFVLNTKRA
jgi:hypothetical protein